MRIRRACRRPGRACWILPSWPRDYPRLQSNPVETIEVRSVRSGVARHRAIAKALLFLAAATACGDPRPELAPPNFVVISVDTLRADHLGSYGYERFTSPRIVAVSDGE